MKQLEYHPLANQYPLMQGEVYEEFKASIQEAGKVRVPIVLYEGKILDGRNRYRAGTELGIKVPIRDFDPETDGDDPEQFVQNMNDDRRHEEQEIIKRRRQERIKRVAEARKQGKSQRQIAEEEGISRVQVNRDLQTLNGHTEEIRSTGPPPGPVEPEGGKVTGRDGRTRTAKPKKPAPREREPGEDDSDFDDRDAARDAKKREARKPKPAKKDALGNAIPDVLRDLFGDTVLTDCIEDLTEAKALVNRVHERLKRKVQHYPFVQVKQAYEHLADAEHAVMVATDCIKPGIPYAVCPACQGKDSAKCKKCRFGGYLPEWRFNELQEQAS